ncbi:uncharacterized protein [Dermacentor andersoni]|uniref:uncharacterized protein n=1 Tax=Dermacentor andersoni TaxID=34620 RepID=UPI002416B4D4|nr:uncharacterized protein LOC126543852 [Dermacentor andersoni]
MPTTMQMRGRRFDVRLAMVNGSLLTCHCLQADGPERMVSWQHGADCLCEPLKCAYGRDCKEAAPPVERKWCRRCKEKYIFDNKARECEKIWWPGGCETCNLFKSYRECIWRCSPPKRNISWWPWGR